MEPQTYELDVIAVRVDYSGDPYLKCTVDGCEWEHAIGWPNETGNLAQITEVACAHLVETHEGGSEGVPSAICSVHSECDMSDGHDGPHRWTLPAPVFTGVEGTNDVSFSRSGTIERGR